MGVSQDRLEVDISTGNHRGVAQVDPIFGNRQRIALRDDTGALSATIELFNIGNKGLQGLVHLYPAVNTHGSQGQQLMTGATILADNRTPSEQQDALIRSAITRLALPEYKPRGQFEQTTRPAASSVHARGDRRDAAAIVANPGKHDFPRY